MRLLGGPEVQGGCAAGERQHVQRKLQGREGGAVEDTGLTPCMRNKTQLGRAC